MLVKSELVVLHIANMVENKKEQKGKEKVKRSFVKEFMFSDIVKYFHLVMIDELHVFLICCSIVLSKRH